jgi:hypothetical protein
MQHILPEHRYPMHVADGMLAQPAAADLEHSRYTPRDIRQQIRRTRPPHVSRLRHRSSETPSKANISPLSRRMSTPPTAPTVPPYRPRMGHAHSVHRAHVLQTGPLHPPRDDS